MHSTIYAVVWYLCLSVCLSHACVKTTELIIMQLELDCSLGTLLYGHQTLNIISLGDPTLGGVLNSRGVRSFIY